MTISDNYYLVDTDTVGKFMENPDRYIIGIQPNKNPSRLFSNRHIATVFAEEKTPFGSIVRWFKQIFLNIEYNIQTIKMWVGGHELRYMADTSYLADPNIPCQDHDWTEKSQLEDKIQSVITKSFFAKLPPS